MVVDQAAFHDSDCFVDVNHAGQIAWPTLGLRSGLASAGQKVSSAHLHAP